MATDYYLFSRSRNRAALVASLQAGGFRFLSHRVDTFVEWVVTERITDASIVDEHELPLGVEIDGANEVKKPTLCLDFDGVVHSYCSGWKGADVIPDPPVEGAIAFMLQALKHFTVVIYSSRSHQPGGVRAMRDWLYSHAGQAWHESPDGPGLEDVEFADCKPAALVSIDDRTLTFDGTWPSIESLMAFKPWNKRDVSDPAPHNGYPGPTPAMLGGDKLFDAIWYAIKGWDISRGHTGGRRMYAGATGNDVRHIYDAVMKVLK